MGTMHMESKSASNYPIPDLVQLLNLSFEGYHIPVHFEYSPLLTMFRKDNIDLETSRVLLAEDKPSGIALIARRGWASRLAAMGIARELRGKGFGTWFMDGLIKDARDRNDREMVLEVIEQNETAVRLYKKHGFQIVRRLVSLIHQNASQDTRNDLQEVDLREVGRLILQFGIPDLPWQLSGESIALLNPPLRAFKLDSAYIAVSNPDMEHIVIWSLLVEPEARGRGLAVELLKNIMANHEGKTWHVPAIWPEELGVIFERAGFQREELSQWQMRLGL